MEEGDLVMMMSIDEVELSYPEVDENGEEDGTAVDDVQQGTAARCPVCRHPCEVDEPFLNVGLRNSVDVLRQLYAVGGL